MKKVKKVQKKQEDVKNSENKDFNYFIKLEPAELSRFNMTKDLFGEIIKRVNKINDYIVVTTVPAPTTKDYVDIGFSYLGEVRALNTVLEPYLSNELKDWLYDEVTVCFNVLQNYSNKIRLTKFNIVDNRTRIPKDVSDVFHFKITNMVRIVYDQVKKMKAGILTFKGNQKDFGDEYAFLDEEKA